MNPDITLPQTPKIRTYTALLDPHPGTAPDVQILQNTLIGTPVWTYYSGYWLLTLTNGFKGKIAAYTTNSAFTGVEKVNDNQLSIKVWTESYALDVMYWLQYGVIKIEVYNL